MQLRYCARTIAYVAKPYWLEYSLSMSSGPVRTSPVSNEAMCKWTRKPPENGAGFLEGIAFHLPSLQYIAEYFGWQGAA